MYNIYKKLGTCVSEIEFYTFLRFIIKGLITQRLSVVK